MSLVVASVAESTELVGWFDAQAASHVASKTKAIVFFTKISRVLEKDPNLWAMPVRRGSRNFRKNCDSQPVTELRDLFTIRVRLAQIPP